LERLCAGWESSYEISLFLQILAAKIWTGGNIGYSLVVLLRVLRERDPQAPLRFESGYERTRTPALVVQVATGLLLAHRLLGIGGESLGRSQPVSRVVSIEPMSLAAKAAFEFDARFRSISRVFEGNLGALARHIVPVTLISIVFVGVSFRTRWLS
jgi:hypothetical protein